MTRRTPEKNVYEKQSLRGFEKIVKCESSIEELKKKFKMRLWPEGKTLN
jgi:hypothetical protein